MQSDISWYCNEWSENYDERPHRSCTVVTLAVDESFLKPRFHCDSLSPADNSGVVIWLERGADLRTAHLMPLPLAVSCFDKIQIGLTFLVPAYPGSPGQRAVKWVCVGGGTTPKIALSLEGGSGPPLKTWFLGCKQHLDRFSHLWRAHGCVRQTDDTTSVARGHVFALCACDAG